MAIIDEILQRFADARFHYKGMTVNIWGIPQSKKYKASTLRASFHRLKQDKLIRKSPAGWVLTAQGRHRLVQKAGKLQHFDFCFLKTASKNLILMFDVPHEHKAKRDWLRHQLKRNHFTMIQKSVWVGPSPLPKEFIAYVKSIGLWQNIKTFRLARTYR